MRVTSISSYEGTKLTESSLLELLRFLLEKFYFNKNLSLIYKNQIADFFLDYYPFYLVRVEMNESFLIRILLSELCEMESISIVLFW